MEEYITRMREYLPIDYAVSDNNEYVEYLMDSFNKTAESEKYQFAFIAFHLLYMSYVFKAIWQSNELGIEKIRKQITNMESKLNGYDNPFDMSVISEQVAVNLLKCHGFHNNKLHQFQSVINNRDHCAHASGFVQYKEDDISKLLDTELTNVQEIQKKLNSLLPNLFTDYFDTHFKPNDTGSLFPNGLDSVESFVRKELLSVNDLEAIISNEFDFLAKETSDLTILYQKVFYLLICHYYDELSIDDSRKFMENVLTIEKGYSVEGVDRDDIYLDQFSDYALGYTDEDYRIIFKVFDLEKHNKGDVASAS